MTERIIRGFFVVVCAIMGGIWGWWWAGGEDVALRWIALGGVIGAASSLALILLLRFVTQDLFEKLWPPLIAIAVAMMIGWFLGHYAIGVLPIIFPSLKIESDQNLSLFLTTTLVLLFGFVGISLSLTWARGWTSIVRAVSRHRMDGANPKLIDTSVLIDGRIVDVCATGFIEGSLIIPRFVLRELQNIADSADVLRRVRGRRGLDIVKSLQQPDSAVKVQVIEDDPPDIREVDSKLVYLARELDAKLVTNDLNLNKMAQIDGIGVLNLNDLANALKPAVLPDEEMHVRIVKEGKETYQGVGYLDDGTMVVVDGGRDHLGRDVSVVVTSVLQTSAGRMIFTKLRGVLT